MSVVICQTPVATFSAHSSAMPHKPTRHANSAAAGHVDIWSMVQSQNMTCTPATTSTYIHPLVQQSRTRMNQMSLDMCTESLGSETGSNDFDDLGWFSMSPTQVACPKASQLDFTERVVNGRELLPTKNKHYSINRRSPQRSFPPPLPSISRLDGSSIHMKPHRRDGRLIVEAVPIPSQNYLCARRHEGRLLLSFNTASICHPDIIGSETTDMMPPQHHYAKHPERVKEPKYINDGDKDGHEIEIVNDGDEIEIVNDGDEEVDEIEIVNDGDEEVDEIEDEEEEEEVEVVDRGTIVEVKVSTQPQQQNRAKVLRSSIVINKFVGGEPLSNENRWPEPQPPILAHGRRMPTITTTAAAAVAASSVSASPEVVGQCLPPTDNRLLFTSKRRNREEMLHNMRRCSELRRPLFFWEPYCIATS